ncbi:hypothetical protein ES703_111208 [subsurface metagenome]
MPKERSVEKDVDGFCGWPFLEDLIGCAPTAFMQALIAALFETGGRISEVLALRRWNVDLTLHPDVAVIQNMPLLKRFQAVGKTTKWKCVGHCKKRWNTKPSLLEYQTHDIREYEGWLTKTIKDQRTFPIRLDEPLTAYFIKWVKTVRKPRDPLFRIKRSAAYVRVRNVGKELNTSIPLATIRSSQLYAHFFRAERACQLAFDYGFTDNDLDRFFGWKERMPRMSKPYASLGWIGLARKMGVKV